MNIYIYIYMIVCVINRYFNKLLLIFYLDYSISVLDGTINTVIDLSTVLQCVQGNNPRSFSFMMQSAATYESGCRGIISTGSFDSALGSLTISICSVTNIIQVDSTQGSYIPTSGKVVNDGLWHMIVVTYDGTTLSIYVDTNLDNTATNWNAGYYTDSSIATTLNTIGTTSNNYSIM